MGARMDIADALPRCFRLPSWITVGDQRWALSTSALHMGPGGAVRLHLLLCGPYRRFRRARVVLDSHTLLAGGYDPSAAAAAVASWLPHSDADDVLEISAAELLPAEDFARPADH